MAGELKILQIGTENWSKYQEVPEKMDWFFFWPRSSTAIRKVMQMEGIHSFDAILLDKPSMIEDLQTIRGKIEPYTIFYDETLSFTAEEEQFFLETCAQKADFSDKESLLILLSKSIFRGQYGDKLFPSRISVHPSLNDKATFYGLEGVEVTADYGDDFRVLASWTYNIIARKNTPIELWLEYEKDDTCEIELHMRKIPEGSVADISETRVFSETDLQDVFIVEESWGTVLSFTILVKGKGRVKIGNLHQRLSRFQFGKFLLGGGMIRDEKRQELTYYFHPGDLKPPLSIYFSGFRPAEGFEGYFMIKSFGTPFLLFSDPRLLGGAFYLGSDELESKVKQVIQDALDRLGFTPDQTIFSGLSMGTFPAMYYGADFNPGAIILGKALASAGTIAQRNRLEAPGILDTWVDVLHLQTGGVEQENITALDQKFWDKFHSADFSNTTFGIAYMKDEDMDPTAFEDIVRSLYDTGAKILRKGTAGRHNDDTDTVVVWFMNFHRMVLEAQFGRK